MHSPCDDRRCFWFLPSIAVGRKVVKDKRTYKMHRTKYFKDRPYTSGHQPNHRIVQETIRTAWYSNWLMPTLLQGTCWIEMTCFSRKRHCMVGSLCTWKQDEKNRETHTKTHDRWGKAEVVVVVTYNSEEWSCHRPNGVEFIYERKAVVRQSSQSTNRCFLDRRNELKDRIRGWHLQRWKGIKSLSMEVSNWKDAS